MSAWPYSVATCSPVKRRKRLICLSEPVNEDRRWEITGFLLWYHYFLRILLHELRTMYVLSRTVAPVSLKALAHSPSRALQRMVSCSCRIAAICSFEKTKRASCWAKTPAIQKVFAHRLVCFSFFLKRKIMHLFFAIPLSCSDYLQFSDRI